MGTNNKITIGAGEEGGSKKGCTLRKFALQLNSSCSLIHRSVLLSMPLSG